METHIRESDWKRFRKLRTLALDRFYKRLTTSCAAAVAASCLLTLLCSAAVGESVILAERGEAQFPVVVASEAGERVRAAAGELAEYLGRIGGAEFAVEEGDGKRGVAVGVFSDFPELGLADRFQPAPIARREEYLLRSHAGGVHIIGATETAVEHAVWDFLQRLGYRQFFPTETNCCCPARSSRRIGNSRIGNSRTLAYRTGGSYTCQMLSQPSRPERHPT